MKKVTALLLAVLSIGVQQSFSQLKIGDQPTLITKSVSLDLQGSNGLQGLWLPRVSDTSITGIRALNPPNGLVIYHPPSGKMLLRSNNSWVSYYSSGVASITDGSQTISGPNISLLTGNSGTDYNVVANSGSSTITLNLPDASTTARGAITTGAQTLGGTKTFANGVTVNNGATINNSATLNGGTTANNGLTVSGATTSTSNLTLGVTSATTPAAQTDRYLSVNSSGNVTLNTLNSLAGVTVGATTVTGPNLTYNTGTSGTDHNISTSGNTITYNIPDASTTARGVITTGAQTLGGAKTFANGVTVNNGATINNGATLNGGTTANNGLTVSGATTSTSNLTLGVTSATTPAAQTDRYLSVNSSGNVTLNTLNSLAGVTVGATTLTGPTLTYNTGTTGTNHNISTSGNTITFNLPDASTTARGAVTTGAQTLGGAKTFANGITVNNGATVNNGTTLNGGTTANNGLTVSGATTSTSNLTLGVTSATTPAAQTDRYLSVNSTGNVTLNSLNPVTSVTANGVASTGNVNFNTGIAGTDFNVSSVSGTVTYNLPDASATSRGAVTTGPQTIGGLKTFATGATVSGVNTTVGTTASNLRLGVTAALNPTVVANKILTVDSSGNVLLASSDYSKSGVNVRKFVITPNQCLTSSVTIGSNSTYIFTFTIPSGSTALDLTAAVFASPSAQLAVGLGIDYAIVQNTSTLLVSVTSRSGSTQTFGVGYKFYIAVIEFSPG